MTDLGTDYLDDKKKKSLKHIADVSNEAQIKVDEEKKKEYYVQKFKGNEAILIGGLKSRPYFLEIVDGQKIIRDEIVLPDMILKPYSRTMYLNKEYAFDSLEEIEEYIDRASKQTFDTLYHEVKGIWTKYIDADSDHLTICAADTIFTYFQDKLGMTHYILFVGDNGSGKSNNLKVFQYLGYRALFDTSITSANIHQFLGSIEEGQGIILEDEADTIDHDSHSSLYRYINELKQFPLVQIDSKNVLLLEDGQFVDVRISDVKIGKRVRNLDKFPDAGFESFVGSIAIDGLINPIIINKDKLLLSGYRRLKACEVLKWETIPAHVLDITDHTKIMAHQFMENSWLNLTKDEVEEFCEKWGIPNSVPKGYKYRDLEEEEYNEKHGMSTY